MCAFLWFILSSFLIVCLSVTVKWLAVKTASEMTYTASGGALNSTQSNPILPVSPSPASITKEKLDIVSYKQFANYRSRLPVTTNSSDLN